MTEEKRILLKNADDFNGKDPSETRQGITVTDQASGAIYEIDFFIYITYSPLSEINTPEYFWHIAKSCKRIDNGKNDAVLFYDLPDELKAAALNYNLEDL